MNPLNKADRELANRSGYIAEMVTGGAIGDIRISGENFGGEMTRGLANFTNRASLSDRVEISSTKVSYPRYCALMW